MAKKEIHIPEVLPVNPISLVCPFCKAKKGKDCATSSGGFSVLYLARIQAAALKDSARKRDRLKNSHRNGGKTSTGLLFTLPLAHFFPGTSPASVHSRPLCKAIYGRWNPFLSGRQGWHYD